MGTELLTTKITLPPLRNRVIPRRRLGGTEETETPPRLTVISAPAGFGKTTTARSIVDNTGGPVAWFSVDREDNEPIRYFTYLIAAIGVAIPTFPKRAGLALESSTISSLSIVLTMVINDLSTYNKPVSVVIDDYHLLSSPEIDKGMEFLISHAPATLRFVIATRRDPKLPLSLFRARGELQEIRTKDLRFAAEETAELFQSDDRYRLSPEDLETLQEHTEGWIAAIQMAELSIRRHPDPKAFLQSFTEFRRHIVDFLTQEVLLGQPEVVQRFLIRSSILSRLNGALCDALTTTPEIDGAETLEYLEQANLFVEAIDEEHRWFRFHPLFAALLRRRLEGDLRQLHQRAALWLIDRGLFEEALPHAIDAESAGLIAKALDAKGIPPYARGFRGPILRRLETLPDHLREKEPMLRIHQAWATWIDYRSNEVPLILDRVDSETLSDQTKGHIYALRANLAANKYDLPTVSSYATSALELLPPHQRFARANVFRLQAISAQFADRRAEALDAYQNVVDIARDAGLTHLRILAETGRGIVMERNLALTDAEARYNEVLRLAGDPDQPITCEAHTGLGRVAYLRNDLVVARQQLERGRDLAKKIQGIDSDLSAEIELCRVQSASGDVAGAARALRRLASIITESAHAQLQTALRSLRIRGAIEAGDTDEIRGYLRELENAGKDAYGEASISTTESMTDASKNFQLDHIRLLLSQGDTDRVLIQLTEVENRAVERGWTDRVVECGVLTSIALAVGGERDRAVTNLQRIWKLLQHENAIRPVIDEGPVARELFEAVLSGNDLVDTGLSKREREVLKHIEAGLSNEEIAEQLYVSVSTIKGHNGRIFEKLGVRRRTEAVIEARRRGILT